MWKLPNVSLNDLIKALISSGINLLFYAIIILMLIGLPQGFVIPLDLFIQDNEPISFFNIFYVHFILLFLALLMSFYPQYIYMFLFGNKSEVYGYRSFCFGLIYYSLGDNTNSKENEKINQTSLKFIESGTRKFLGYALFFLWSGLLVRVYTKHQIIEFSQYFVLFNFFIQLHNAFL